MLLTKVWVQDWLPQNDFGELVRKAVSRAPALGDSDLLGLGVGSVIYIFNRGCSSF